MKQCVILIGGKGSRLGEITKSFPKPMLSIDNKPFLIHLIDQIQKFGFEKILLLSGHSGEVVENYFKENNSFDIPIQIIKEDMPLGTGGALVNAYEHLDDSFFLMNGDSIIGGNWLAISELLDSNNDLAMALVKKSDCNRYGSVALSGNKITKFIEKKETKEEGFVNGGVYYVKKKIFSHLTTKNISFEKDILSKLVKNKKVSGLEIKGYFIDIGTPSSLSEANKTNWFVEKKAVILDRDGTLNEDQGYTHKVSDLKWKPGAISLIRYLNDRNFLVFVATNQAGIAKGIFKESDMHSFHYEMQNQLRKNGAHIDQFYFCPYHSKGKINTYTLDSSDRKPRTGMLEKISSNWGIKKNNMLLIGDRDSDIECAKNFSIPSIKYNGLDNLLDLKDNIEKIMR